MKIVRSIKIWETIQSYSFCISNYLSLKQYLKNKLNNFVTENFGYITYNSIKYIIYLSCIINLSVISPIPLQKL